MRFQINLPETTLPVFMRQCGYAPAGRGKTDNELAFQRPLTGHPYPKFHLYCVQNERFGPVFINLHLDQKAPSYRGASAHSGEYDGPLIEEEAERIAKIAQTLI